MKQSFYWSRLREDVNGWVARVPCGAVSKPSKTPCGPIGEMTVGAIMDRLSTDVLGPFPETPRGDTYILVLTDHFIKRVEIFDVASQTAITTARIILNEVIAWFGCPYSILGDQGKNYESCIFTELSVSRDPKEESVHCKSPLQWANRALQPYFVEDDRVVSPKR